VGPGRKCEIGKRNAGKMPFEAPFETQGKQGSRAGRRWQKRGEDNADSSSEPRRVVVGPDESGPVSGLGRVHRTPETGDANGANDNTY